MACAFMAQRILDSCRRFGPRAALLAVAWLALSAEHARACGHAPVAAAVIAPQPSASGVAPVHAWAPWQAVAEPSSRHVPFHRQAPCHGPQCDSRPAPIDAASTSLPQPSPERWDALVAAAPTVCERPTALPLPSDSLSLHHLSSSIFHPPRALAHQVSG